MTVEDRGVHPDLVEEEQQAAQAAQETQQEAPARGRRNGRSRAPQAP